MPAAVESDASVPCCGMNGWQSRWLWQRHSTTPPGPAKNDALRGQKTVTRAREGEVREEHQALRGQTRLPPGMRPALLVEVQPQGCVERHIVEDPSELAPMVQTLDAPVPQMVDTVLEFFRALDLPVDEQTLVERRLPQMVEQLVDVPTVLSPLRIAEQIVGSPAPQRGGNWSLQGPLPGQSSTLSPLPKRISERIVEQIAVSSPAERISERIVEQIAVPSTTERISERIVEQFAAGGDFPSRRAGPRVVLPRQGSAAAGAEQLADIVSWPGHVDEPLPESAEWVLFRATATDRPFYWNRCTNATAWKPPPGINVVWVGEKPEGGGVWYWHKGTRASTYDLPPLPPE